MFPNSLQHLTQDSGIPTNLRKSFLAKLQVPLFLLAFFIKGLITSFGSDIIHAHWTAAGYIGGIIKLLIKKPLIITVRGSDVHGMNTNIGRYFVRRVLKRADFVTAVSKNLGVQLRKWGIDMRKVHVVPNGVDIEQFSRRPKAVTRKNLELAGNSKYVLYVGRLAPVKGVEFLIQVIPEVMNKRKQVRFILVGDGDSLHFLQKLAIKLGVKEHVHFVGRQPQGKVAEYMAAADILVLPSLGEGRPNTVLEAMASGLPVIATRVGGVPEIVLDGVTGYVVPPRNTKELSEKISFLLKNPHLCKSMGQSGKDLLGKLGLSWENSAKKTIEIYQECIERKESKL
jgi:glycosyltransferase involved in cell wall biosynthesis